MIIIITRNINAIENLTGICNIGMQVGIFSIFVKTKYIFKECFKIINKFYKKKFICNAFDTNKEKAEFVVFLEILFTLTARHA